MPPLTVHVLSTQLKISSHMITPTLIPLTAAHYKPRTLKCLHPLLHWCCTRKTLLCRGESVKKAVLLRWRIRAVVFNQSSQWQNLRCSRGDRDDDSCWRVKHQKYTCTLICSRWNRAYSAMSVLRAAFWGGRWKGILELQKYTGLHRDGTQRARRYSQVILFLSQETWC